MQPNLLALLVVLTFLLFPAASWDAAAQQDGGQSCPNADGWIPGESQLEAAIAAHMEWIRLRGWTDTDIQGRAVLCNADLRGADLVGVDLRRADLSGADLRFSDLTLTSFLSADLSGASLAASLLTGANLGGADLSNADLFRSNIQDANIFRTDFSGANLRDADFAEKRLLGSSFAGADLTNANFVDANLADASLAGALLANANMTRAVLSRADLSGANLSRSLLVDADLGNSNLSDVNLTDADLSNANLEGANISGARLNGSQLAGAILHSVGAPNADYLYDIEGLDQIEFELGRESALVSIRGQLQQLGQDDLERHATYSIEANRVENAFEIDFDGNLQDREVIARWFSAALSTVAFGWPAEFGMESSRPLVLLAATIILMAIPYTLFIRFPSDRSPQTGGTSLYRIYPKGRIVRQGGGDLKEGEEVVEWIRERKWWKAFTLGLYLSFLSSFRLGFREFNIGVWISRIQRREYELRAIGWARTLSGIQSVFSLYMIISWFIFTFLRPLH